MATPLIPTKSQLSSIQYTPAQLIEDQALETMIVTKFGSEFSNFIRALVESYRAGQSSVSYTFKNNAANLANIDSADVAILGAALSKSTTQNGFGYTVITNNLTLSVSWA